MLTFACLFSGCPARFKTFVGKIRADRSTPLYIQITSLDKCSAKCDLNEQCLSAQYTHFVDNLGLCKGFPDRGSEQFMTSYPKGRVLWKLNCVLVKPTDPGMHPTMSKVPKGSPMPAYNWNIMLGPYRSNNRSYIRRKKNQINVRNGSFNYQQFHHTNKKFYKKKQKPPVLSIKVKRPRPTQTHRRTLNSQRKSKLGHGSQFAPGIDYRRRHVLVRPDVRRGHRAKYFPLLPVPETTTSVLMMYVFKVAPTQAKAFHRNPALTTRQSTLPRNIPTSQSPGYNINHHSIMSNPWYAKDPDKHKHSNVNNKHKYKVTPTIQVNHTQSPSQSQHPYPANNDRFHSNEQKILASHLPYYNFKKNLVHEKTNTPAVSISSQKNSNSKPDMFGDPIGNV